MPNPTQRDHPQTRPVRTASGRKTCLVCYAPLRVERGTVACGGCGFEQGRTMQERYWSLEPQVCRVQKWLRGGALLVTVVIGVLLAQGMGGASLFWGLGLLAAVGWLLWYTAGCMTRRKSFMDLRFLWPPLLLAVAVGPFVVSFLFAWIEGRLGEGLGIGAGLLWAAPWLVPLALSLWLPKRFANWRQAKVEAGSGSSPDAT